MGLVPKLNKEYEISEDEVVVPQTRSLQPKKAISISCQTKQGQPRCHKEHSV